MYAIHHVSEQRRSDSRRTMHLCDPSQLVLRLDGGEGVCEPFLCRGEARGRCVDRKVSNFTHSRHLDPTSLPTYYYIYTLGSHVLGKLALTDMHIVSGTRVLSLDDKTARKNAKADLALLSAAWVPSADAAGCRLMADWNHWVFVFDDRTSRASHSYF